MLRYLSRYHHLLNLFHYVHSGLTCCSNIFSVDWYASQVIQLFEHEAPEENHWLLTTFTTAFLIHCRRATASISACAVAVIRLLIQQF